MAKVTRGAGTVGIKLKIMKNLNKLMEHYKQTVRIDANNA